MFSKISRYRKLADIVTTDVKGRTLESKSLRLLPEVSGTFLHTVEEVDRLDNLAYKYYKQPRKWWRICDANPEFMSPQALLGKEPVRTVRFYLTFNHNDADPPWYDLIRNLSGKLGVEEVKVVENVSLLPKLVFKVTDQSLASLKTAGVSDDVLEELENIKNQNIIGKEEFLDILKTIIENERVEEFKSLIIKHSGVTHNGEKTIIHRQRVERSVIITYNQMNVGAEELADVMTATGFEAGQPENIGQVGKSIIVPPNVLG